MIPQTLQRSTAGYQTELVSHSTLPVICLMDILYKYVTAERALTCLPEVGDGTLRATQPSALNDPLECAVMIVFVDPDEPSRNRECARVLTMINENSPVAEDEVSRARERHGSLYLRELVANQYSTRFGVVSFSEDHFNPLMWSHYTTDGSGFVIGYDAQLMAELSSRPEGLRAVRYADRLPPIMDFVVLAWPETNIDNLLSVKSDVWGYEREWRLIVELNETIGTGQKDHLGLPINLIRVPNRAVVSVYYTERTPPETVRLVRERLANPNNRYGVLHPTKLVLSAERYGYEEANETQ